MSSHAPKTAALMAYESGALSKAGRARVERHLRDCPACQRELAAIQAYEATVDSIRDERGPELDWSKMELALEREAHLQARKHRRSWVMPATGVALAAAAALLLVVRGAPSEMTTIAEAPRTHVVDREPTRLPEPTAETAPAYADAVVTLVAGHGEVRSGDSVAHATTGTRIGVDDVLATSESGSLHARLAPGVGIALEPSTELRLAALDEGGEAPNVAAMALDHGRVGAYVHQARTVILAGQFRIECDVARFVIDFDAERAALSVDVHEGEVHVTGPSVDEHLTAPARFPSDASALEASVPVGASDDYDALPTLHIAHGDIVRWEIGDVAVSGADELAMRVGAGPATIRGWDAHGHVFRASVTIGADGLDLSPDELRPEAPRIRAGTLSVEEIAPVVHQHMAALQRCYEHQLRATPELSVRVQARISIEMTGSVADDGVRFDGDEMPAAMAQCMSNQIETWIFPAPHGGPVTVGVPFNFEHR